MLLGLQHLVNITRGVGALHVPSGLGAPEQIRAAGARETLGSPSQCLLKRGKHTVSAPFAA